MATWFVDRGTVVSVLRSAGGTFDSLAEQVFGSGGGDPWGDRASALGEAAGDDGVVAGAFQGLVDDQMNTASHALGKFGDVLRATHDAAQAYLEGHRVMAASIVAAAGQAMNIAGANPYEGGG